MSDCEEALRELHTFLDGELTNDRRVLIRSHLDGCTDCFGAFDFELELRQVIARKCAEAVPDELRARIARALTEPPDADSSGTGSARQT